MKHIKKAQSPQSEILRIKIRRMIAPMIILGVVAILLFASRFNEYFWPSAIGEFDVSIIFFYSSFVFLLGFVILLCLIIKWGIEIYRQNRMPTENNPIPLDGGSEKKSLKDLEHLVNDNNRIDAMGTYEGTGFLLEKHCVYCLRIVGETDRLCPFCGKPVDADTPYHQLPPGTLLQDRYYVGAALGQGGFGITYAGYDTQLLRRVAIKEYYPNGFVNRNNTVSSTIISGTNTQEKDYFEKGKQRFLEEARTLAFFSGMEGIVNVIDCFPLNNTVYIIMEYIEGITLKKYISSRGSIPMTEAITLLMPIMQSLQQIHKKGLIHRDISPDNIMLLQKGDQITAKLIDFGAAREVSSIGNKSLTVVLKPGFAPLEQYNSIAEQGPWTDIYALSATLYYCITGIAPPAAPDRLMGDVLKTPSSLGVDIDANSEKALIHAMNISAQDRYGCINYFLQDLITEENSKEKNFRKKTKTAKSHVALFRKKSILITTVALVVGLAVISAIIGIKTTKSTRLSVPYGSWRNVKTGDLVSFGHYEQDNKTRNGMEPILWEVISVEDSGSALRLLSCKILDFEPYDNTTKYPLWQKSSIREWLNNDFFDTAFTEAEKKRVNTLTYSIDDKKVDTNTHIALLFPNEAEEYLSTDDKRMAEVTPYAKAKLKKKSADMDCLKGWWLADYYTVYEGNILKKKADVSLPYGVRPMIFVERYG